MIIDTIAILLLVLAVWKGYSKGLIIAVFSLLAFIIGLAAAVKLSAVVAGWLGTQASINKQWIPTVAFLVVFIAVVFVVRFTAVLVEKTIKLAMLGWVNKIGGIIFYALLYLFIYSLLLFYGKQINIISDKTISESNTYKHIAPFGQKVIDGIGMVVPIFKDLFTQLGNFFESLKAKI